MSNSSRGLPYYSPAPFHVLRTVSGLSCTVISGVLIYFCMQLKNDGFKLPWTLLIVLAAAILNLLALVLTVLISCCGSRSPLIIFLINLPIFLFWVVAFSILTYNIYGMLAHSCSISVWAANEGVTVCNIYKTFYTFVIFASFSQLALLGLDVKARRTQVRMGKYDKMDASKEQKRLQVGPTTNPYSPAQAQQHDQGWRPGHMEDKKGPVAESYELQSPSQAYYEGSYISPHHAQSQFTHGQSDFDAQYSNTSMRHGTPEYVGSEYSHGSQYQAHAYVDVHERGGGQHYVYGQSPPSSAYNSRGYAYDNRGY